MGFEFIRDVFNFIYNVAFILYWAITAIVLWYITRAKWQPWKKVVVGLIVGGILIGWPAKQYLDKRTQDQAASARYAAADARFEMRCQSAGEKIYKTVEDVEGVMLLKVRPERETSYHQYNQYAEDPYGGNSEGDGYIEIFLWGVIFMGICRG